MDEGRMAVQLLSALFIGLGERDPELLEAVKRNLAYSQCAARNPDTAHEWQCAIDFVRSITEDSPIANDD